MKPGVEPRIAGGLGEAARRSWFCADNEPAAKFSDWAADADTQVMQVSPLNALIRIVLGVPLFAVGLALAFGASFHAAWALALAAILGWMVMTAAVIVVGEALPFWGAAGPGLVSCVVSACIAIGYARVMGDSLPAIGFVAVMAVIAAVSLLAAVVSFRRARRNSIEFEPDGFGPRA